MMISPKEIRDSAIALADSTGGYYSETPQALEVKGVFTEPILAQWREVALGLDESGIGTLDATDSLGEPVDLRTVQPDELADEIRLRLRKTEREGATYLFFASGLPVLLEDQSCSVDTLVAFIAEEFLPFRTASCAFSVWRTANPSLPAELTPDIDPRKFTRDLTGTGTVPQTIGFYLLKEKPAQESDVFRIWAKAATPNLALALVDEVWREDHELMISLIGPRTKRIPLGTLTALDMNLFYLLQQAAEWVYASSREVEVRHTLFTNELAREWPETSSFFDQFASRVTLALDSARTAYSAHIRDGSKETLKTLSDLRKTLSDEVSKVSAQTRELIGTLWKDFAIAATALLSRIALLFADKKPAADSTPMRIVFLGTAAFIVANLAITLRTNARFMRIAEKSRSAWKQKLFGFLSDEDMRALAEEPIEESIAAYKHARAAVISIYALVVILLLSMSAPDLTAAILARLDGIVVYIRQHLGF
jgi:hypothetical protein